MPKVMDLFAKSKLNMAKISETEAKVQDLYAGAEHKAAQAEWSLCGLCWIWNLWT